MHLIPPPVNIGPKEGFTKNDFFGYSAFGDGMMNIVAANAASEFVMLLDGSWGTGKSVFAKQWAGLLRKNNFPVIEFDAFRNDYQEDAFLAFAGEVYDLGKTGLDAEHELVSGFLDKAKKAGAVLAPMLAKAGVRAVTAGLISTEDAGKTAQVFIDAIGDDGSEAVEKIISKQLETRNSERDALTSFSASLSDMAAALGKSREDRPLVIIVDELDRCKPTFALNILERIKHLFSTKNVVFVLAADFEQLKNVVAGAYGGDSFDGAKYLEKFFHVRTALPKTERLNKSGRYVEYLWTQMEITSGNPDLSKNCKTALSEVAEANRMSCREIERITTNIILAFQSTPKASARLSLILFGLCVIRHVAPKVFDDALAGSLKLSDLFEVMECEGWPEDEKYWFTQIWTALLEPESEQLEDRVRDHFIDFYRGPERKGGEKVAQDLARRISSFHIEPP